MKFIKSCFLGENSSNIKLDNHLWDMKYESTETSYYRTGNVHYEIRKLKDNERELIATTNGGALQIKVLYTDELLHKIVVDTCGCGILKVDYKERTFMSNHNNKIQDTVYNFADAYDDDFIFNLNIKDGTGTELREYIQELEWIYCTYGKQKYL